MNSTVYNEKLKRAHIRANYVSKRKIQEGEGKAEEISQTRGWLLLRGFIPPQSLCTPKLRQQKNPTRVSYRRRKGAGSRKLRSLHQKSACKEAEALTAEKLSSDTPEFWREQNLLRILTERGRNTLSPLTKQSAPLNLRFLCP